VTIINILLESDWRLYMAAKIIHNTIQNDVKMDWTRCM